MYVYKHPQRQWLAAVEQELAQRMEERSGIEKRIVELQRIAEKLRPVLKNADELAEVSLPQLCLRVLGFSGQLYQSPIQLRDGLKAMGVQIPGKNPMGVLHTTLYRLTKGGYVDAKALRAGGPLVFRITPTGRTALQL